MIPPNSFTRAILDDRLNFEATNLSDRQLHLPNPPKSEHVAARKRPVKKNTQDKSRKKAKTSHSIDETLEEDTEEEDPNFLDAIEEEKSLPLSRVRRRTVFRALSSFASTSANAVDALEVSTRPLLQTFVSSLKSDVYTLQSLRTNHFLTPPYACAYSHSARTGGVPLLAVATEEGTVQIINTTRRKPWDPEPNRVTLQPHENGIFDVKWDRIDAHIATCSGDHSSRITSVEKKVTTHVLHGHTSTVKTTCWDPTNDALLATGGRDGLICLWDLRTNTTTMDDVSVLEPVIVIPNAHGDPTKPKRQTKKTNVSVPKTVTSIIYPSSQPYGLVSSGAADGILRFWDLRKLAPLRFTKVKPPSALYSTLMDPTTINGSKRPRGIISLVQGFGPTSGLVFGLGHDSKIHTYSLPALTAQPTGLSEATMHTSSFYVGLALSPCGSWLACGANDPRSSNFLFEVSGTGRLGTSNHGQRAVQLHGQGGEMGAVDWADGCLATCADDGTVRVWRPDIEAYRQCMENPDDAQWDWCWSKQTIST